MGEWGIEFCSRDIISCCLFSLTLSVKYVVSNLLHTIEIHTFCVVHLLKIHEL